MASVVTSASATVAAMPGAAEEPAVEASAAGVAAALVPCGSAVAGAHYAWACLGHAAAA